MACQRLFIATIAGDAAKAAANKFKRWREAKLVDTLAVDRFCVAVQENGDSLPVMYFSEWVDRWLMGDQVPGPEAVEGGRFQVACYSRSEALQWARRSGKQYQEQEWLANRLQEAASAWAQCADPAVVIFVREILGSSTSDEEVLASLSVVPSWLM